MARRTPTTLRTLSRPEASHHSGTHTQSCTAATARQHGVLWGTGSTEFQEFQAGLHAGGGSSTDCDLPDHLLRKGCTEANASGLVREAILARPVC
jgi:hypothetical protein